MTGYVFPSTPAPVVSIVMPVYGGWEWAARSLGAVLSNTDDPYELIVVDDASPDGTADAVEALVENARIIRNRENVGFGASCNIGAAAARGQHLVFLNSDALVHRGWLPPLIETSERTGVGAVGPRFLNLDGSVQEAGVLLFRDGWTRAYGSGSAPDIPEFRRRRVVDYVSAACLTVKRRLFNDVGGFDPVYAKGYFEDTELCLSLATAGYRTVYEPRSTVTHVGGWSPAASDAAGALVTRNRPIFATRWSEFLTARPPMSDRNEDVLAARDAPASDRILVASPVQLARTLAATCPWAHVLFIDGGGVGPAGTAELLDVGVEIVAGDLGEIERNLAGRPLHYDVVVLAATEDPLEQVVRATQPQASFVVDPPQRFDALVEVLADVGVEVGRDSAVLPAGCGTR